MVNEFPSTYISTTTTNTTGSKYWCMKKHTKTHSFQNHLFGYNYNVSLVSCLLSSLGPQARNSVFLLNILTHLAQVLDARVELAEGIIFCRGAAEPPSLMTIVYRKKISFEFKFRYFANGKFVKFKFRLLFHLFYEIS